MRASRKKFQTTRNLFLGFLALVTVATVVYINLVNPLFSQAASSYMMATITDDNSTVDFSPGNNNVTATFSYMKVSSSTSDSKIYSAKIILTNLPTGKSKTLKVTLPMGMVWVDDASGDGNLASQLESPDGITSESLNVSPVLGYTFSNSGSRIYHILESSTALTVNIQVKADRTISLTEINDAIKATLSISGESDTIATLSKVSVPTGATTPGNYHGSNRTLYVSRGIDYQTNENLYRRVTAYVVAGYDQVVRLYTQMSFKLTVSDPRAIIKLNADNNLWSIDSSDSANGNYTITFTPETAVHGVYNVPYTINFSNSIPVGTEVQLEYHDGHVLMWTPSGINDISFGGSNTVKFVTLPDEASVAVGQSTLNPNLATSTTQNNNKTSVGLQREEIGTLGYSYINNRGSTDSTPQTLELNFNTNGNTTFGVMAVVIPCGQGVTSIASVDYKTQSNNTWRTATISGGKICSTAGTGHAHITYADLGLTRPSDSNPGNYIKAIRYNLGVIPKGTQLMTTTTYTEGIFIYGRRLNASAGQFTVQSYGTDNDTGITTVNTPAYGGDEGFKDGSIDIAVNKAPVVDAGNRLNFQWTLGTWGNATTLYPYNSPNPVIYIRSELKDSNGNFLPLKDIKVKDSGARGSADITSKFGTITYEDTATARIYKLDGRNVTDGSAAIIHGYVKDTGVTTTGLVITYSVDTDYATPDQRFNLEDALFVQDTVSKTFRTHSITGDPFGISDTPGYENQMVHVATNLYYQVRGFSSVGVDNSARRAGTSDWTKWDEGDDSIISSSDTNIEMKTTVMNNSGVAITNPTIVYVPIPKNGENWGALSYNNQAFNFSMALTGAVTKGSGTNNFTVTYGTNVTPSDDGEALNNQSSKFSASPANWDNVNCIKIVANNIPANPAGTISEYDFTYTLKVVDPASAGDGTLNTWRPVYYQNLVNSNGDVFSGWKNSSYISLKLVDGKINGTLFLDVNENGKFDSGESALTEADWIIALYNKSTNELVKTTTTNANGEYAFGEIPMSADGYYIIVTNKHPLNAAANVSYFFAPKGTTSNTGAYNTDNQAVGDEGSNPIHQTAIIDPISPSMTAGQATYNIGVISWQNNPVLSGINTNGAALYNILMLCGAVGILIIGIVYYRFGARRTSNRITR